MKKSKKLLIKIGLIFISLCFLCILCNNSVGALSTQDVVSLPSTLYDTYDNHKYYCVEPGTNFKGGEYKVTEKWEIIGNTVFYNDYEQTDPDTKKTAIARAYILAEEDDNEISRLNKAFKICESWTENAQRPIKNGIYNVLSYKQEAFWMLQGCDWYWKNTGSLLEYPWDVDGDGNAETFGIKRTGLFLKYYKFLRIC